MKLFLYAGAMDLADSGNHSKLMEFYKLDKQIAERYDYNYENDISSFHDFELALMVSRAKYILRQLDIIN